MNYQYRVTLTGIKGFFRVYSVNAANSLYTFHKRLQEDLEFPADQPILFKAFDANGNVIARYALVDLGSGTVDTVSIERTIKEGAVSFTYFYDIKGKKSVNVTLESESAENGHSPKLLESKGPVPLEFENGYVAFEDMPEEHRRIPSLKDTGAEGNEEDDDDDDDEEEESDKEEEEIIYDANEE